MQQWCPFHDLLQCGLLEEVAKYLAPPSKILFALALTAPKNPYETIMAQSRLSKQISSSIVGSNWDTLDFGDIEKDLAARLSDDDISDVLQHIDASNKLINLRLTNCINITGISLQSLRGSTIIEQIDLSLLGDGENTRKDFEQSISCEIVLPILDSIIAAEGCSLRYLEFPYKWRRDTETDFASTDSEFHAFILRYNEMRENMDAVWCLNCNEYIPPVGRHWIGRDEDECYGLHNYTCSCCTGHYCYDCPDNDEEEGIKVFGHCDKCQRDYCQDCAKFYRCGACDDLFCDYCSKSCTQCNHCSNKICSECIEHNIGHGCSYCGVAYCRNNHCNRLGDGDEKVVQYCRQCRKYCCKSCRLRIFQEEGGECVECIKLLPNNEVLQVLMQQSVRLKQEVEVIKNENRELKIGMREVEQLKNEIKELKLQMK
jgi:hypothetical protein